MEKPFGDFKESRAPYTTLNFENFDPDNFDTKVFTTVKPQSTKKRNGNYFQNDILKLPKANPMIRFVKKVETLSDLKKEWDPVLKNKEDKLEEISAEPIKLDKKVKAKLVTDLHRTTESVVSFLIEEIMPLQASIDIAADKVERSLSLILDVEADVDLGERSMVGMMLRDAIDLKTFDFLCEKLGLPKELKDIVINKYYGDKIVLKK